jgi:hypothetical protein
MAKERALDMFQVLARIDAKDYSIWDSLNEEQIKELSPYMLLRWMTGTNDEKQLIFLNRIVNTLLFTVGNDHRELMLKLLTVSASGGTKRYKWQNHKTLKKATTKLSLQVVMDYNHFTERHAIDAMRIYISQDIIEMAEDLGWQNDEIKALKKELGVK